MSEFHELKHQKAELQESRNNSSVLGVSAMEAPRVVSASPRSAASFHDQVDNLVNNNQKKKEIDSKWWGIGGIASSIQTSLTDTTRGQQLCQIFSAAS